MGESNDSSCPAGNRYGGAVLLEQIAEMLPKIAARVSAPLSQVGSTVFLQSDEGGWPQYIMSVREVVETITGVGIFANTCPKAFVTFSEEVSATVLTVFAVI
eukprot:SAG31_NODE_389_length_16370_cov_4.517915_11_plen_102_part_00